MIDSLKIGEYYTLILYHKDFYEYLSYVDVNSDIIRTTIKPEKAIHFDSEFEAKNYFFDRFGFFQHHYGINLVDVVVGKMVIKYELEICKDSYVSCQVNNNEDDEKDDE